MPFSERGRNLSSSADVTNGLLWIGRPPTLWIVVGQPSSAGTRPIEGVRGDADRRTHAVATSLCSCLRIAQSIAQRPTREAAL
jgi:hypothetical protein